jgi:hypothetical protein
MCESETRSYKWGRVQENEPNDFQKCIPTLVVALVREF